MIILMFITFISLACFLVGFVCVLDGDFTVRPKLKIWGTLITLVLFLAPLHWYMHADETLNGESRLYNIYFYNNEELAVHQDTNNQYFVLMSNPLNIIEPTYRVYLDDDYMQELNDTYKNYENSVNHLSELKQFVGK